MTIEGQSEHIGSVLGTRVTRTEDPGLLTGASQFLSDLHFERPLHAVFVRSYVAHGTVEGIDVSEARAMPGVVDVWTADELRIAPHHGIAAVDDAFIRPPLAIDTVRFVGEAVAVVLAESLGEAVDAAAAVVVDIAPLPVVIDPEDALDPARTPIFPQRPDNTAIVDMSDELIDLESISDVVIRGRYVNQRIAPAYMEVQCCAAELGADGRLTLWASNQLPQMVRSQLAQVMELPLDQVRVVIPQVGGGFGGKGGHIHEYTVVSEAARRLGRPVIWVPTRSEDMQAMVHGRGQVQYAELGCRADGRFTGLRVHVVGDAGAYPGIGAMLPGISRRMGPGPYDIADVSFRFAVAVTNTVPTGAYRGAGRPEATSLIERLVDQAAAELEIDPIALRELNLIADDAFPYTTATGYVYDSGRYRDCLRRAAELAGYEELRSEQATRRAAGDRLQLGIGVSSYVEVTAPSGGEEFGRLEVHDDGAATVYCGTLSHGQGHQTAYAMLVSEQTGIPVEQVTLVDGDTDAVPEGMGTGGSRSLQLGGSAVQDATRLLVERAKETAARELEAHLDDVVLDVESGAFSVAGVPSVGITWSQLASAEKSEGAVLSAESVFRPTGATFPFGAHITVVEVDIEIGKVHLLRHFGVDDCGNIVNPLLVEGQQYGGVAAGIGQALYEHVQFDGDGNPQTGTFADYCIPSAADVPSIDVGSTITPTSLNPLGVKGIGEAATIGSTAAVQNAVIDAVRHLGVEHIDMPCTPERVWRAINNAQADGGANSSWRQPPAIFNC